MTGHYFSEQPEVASNVRRVPLHLHDVAVELDTDRGVFSADRIDPGTRVLLSEAGQPGDAQVILDLGCGYGAIACTVASRAPAADVWAVDVNERAVALCTANAARLGLDRVTACPPEAVPAEVRFDLVVSNPPIRIGKKALHTLLLQWLGRLTPGGHAELVVHKHLGSDSLARWLGDQGHATTRLLSRSGYRILRVEAADRT